LPDSSETQPSSATTSDAAKSNADAVGLQTLKEMIGKYEEILKLLAPKK
jgi:hypothetical protein